MIILQDQIVACSVLICNRTYSECQTKLVLRSKSDTQRGGRRKEKSKRRRNLSLLTCLLDAAEMKGLLWSLEFHRKLALDWDIGLLSEHFQQYGIHAQDFVSKG